MTVDRDRSSNDNRNFIDPSLEVWVLVATILASSMAFIDGTVVNVALPVLQVDLNVNVASVQWVVEAYTLFLASLLLTGGALGDRYGRKLIFVIGIIVFTLSSIAAGLAPNIGILIAARSVQGIGGALLVPGSLAIITSSFNPKRRGRAIGTWSGFSAITTAFGPVLGGWLVQTISWRAVFFINVPIAAAALVLIFWRVPESRNEQADARLDWQGAVLATMGLGGIVFGLIESSTLGLSSPIVYASIITGAIVLAGFLVVEARKKKPMMPLHLFRSSTFSGANLLTFFLYGALGVTFFFLPFNLIQVHGYTPAAAGAANLPFPILLFLLSRWSGGLINRYGSRLPLIIGPSISAIGLGLFALPGIGGSYWSTFFPAVVVFGLGMSLTVAPLTTTVMGSVETRSSGTASGINNAVSRVGGLLAIALLGLIMVSVFGMNLRSQLFSENVPESVIQTMESERSDLATADIPSDLSPGMQATVKHALNTSFIAGYRAVTLTCAGLAVLSAAAAGLMVEKEFGKVG